MKLLLLILSLIILTSCSNGNLIWGKHDRYKQQKEKKTYYGLGSGRKVGHGW